MPIPVDLQDIRHVTKDDVLVDYRAKDLPKFRKYTKAREKFKDPIEFENFRQRVRCKKD